MEKKENLEIKMAPEELTAEDLKKVSGGSYTGLSLFATNGKRKPLSCGKDDSRKK